jgi:N-formylglutamate deformylase
MSEPIVALREGDGPVIAAAIHDGKRIRPGIAERLAIDEATRRREEDPFTGWLARIAPTWLIGLRSRFEVDLNRPREEAVYRDSEAAWGLDLWREPLPPDEIARSLDAHARFYALLERVLRARERVHGRFVVLDLHLYNHRRGGPRGEPADPATNPEVNIGTGSLDRARWGPLVDRFCGDLASRQVRGHRLDVRENVVFQGGFMPRWVHRTFPTSGCTLAIELKKTFMDEWTGAVDVEHLTELAQALAYTLPGLVDSLSELGRRPAPPSPSSAP